MTEEDEEANDESKIFYNPLGYATLAIDDVLKHFLMTSETSYHTVRPVYLDSEDADASQ